MPHNTAPVSDFDPIFSFHALLPTLSDTDFRFAALPSWLSGEQKLAISKFFNQGRNTNAVQPTIPDCLTLHEKEISMTAFQAGRELREDTGVQLPSKPFNILQDLKTIDVDVDFFDGEGDFQTWAEQLAGLFAVSGSIYPDEQTKMLAAISKLKDAALQWVVIQHVDYLSGVIKFDTYADFLRKLGEKFDDPEQRARACRRMLTMQQDGSCAEYYNEFQSLFHRLRLQESPLVIEAFTMGLNSHLQDVIALSMPGPPTDSLEDYANWCIQLDEQLTARQIMRNKAGVPFRFRRTSSHGPTSSPNHLHQTPESAKSRGDPIQSGAGSLPFKHTKTGTLNYGHCWKCGQRGHTVMKCNESE